MFVSPEHSAAALGAVGAAGFEIEPMNGIDRVAVYETKRAAKAEPSVRLNLILPAQDPEYAATVAPETRTVGGKMVKVFPLVLLLAAKWYANRPEDDLDFGALLNRGLMSTRAVVDDLRATDDPDGAVEFEERMRELVT